MDRWSKFSGSERTSPVVLRRQPLQVSASGFIQASVSVSGFGTLETSHFVWCLGFFCALQTCWMTFTSRSDPKRDDEQPFTVMRACVRLISILHAEVILTSRGSFTVA